MAERTTQSWTQVPHFFLVREIDAGALLQMQEQRRPAIERERGVKVTHTDLLVALTARVLKKHSKVNASWTGDAIQVNPQVNISVAMAVPDGVVGAVIANADSAALADIVRQFKARRIEVLLCGMRSAPNLGPDYGRAFESIFPELAAANDIIFYPFFLDGVIGDRALVQADGLHPTAEGAARIAERIMPKVEELVARVRAKP